MRNTRENSPHNGSDFERGISTTRKQSISVFHVFPPAHPPFVCLWEPRNLLPHERLPGTVLISIAPQRRHSRLGSP